ncbi:MAG TPA: hypothetical protein ENH85_02140 [Candidatus Scalindua sp.]|nr:hypothetical protein [Candidatus Scalindua sp.]
MRTNFKYSNGDKVIEKVTGFSGIITGAVCYMTGCNQYLITAKSKNEKEEATTLWYDEGRLDLIKEEAIPKKDILGRRKGCDIQAPKK